MRGVDVRAISTCAQSHYAGHETENYYHRDTSYNVSVRMDNGATRTFTYKAAPGFQVGDRVHVENGSLAAG